MELSTIENSGCSKPSLERQTYSRLRGIVLVYTRSKCPFLPLYGHKKRPISRVAYPPRRCFEAPCGDNAHKPVQMSINYLIGTRFNVWLRCMAFRFSAARRSFCNAFRSSRML